MTKSKPATMSLDDARRRALQQDEEYRYNHAERMLPWRVVDSWDQPGDHFGQPRSIWIRAANDVTVLDVAYAERDSFSGQRHRREADMIVAAVNHIYGGADAPKPDTKAIDALLAENCALKDALYGDEVTA